MAKAVPQVMHRDNRVFEPRFEHGDLAGIAEVTGSAHGTKLGTGFAKFHNAEIPWTVRYDEVILVLDGEMTVRTEQGDLHAYAQDCIWLPEGTELTYIADDALVFYAIEPANWAESRT
ncbi:MAG: ethanolamine utilization protein EutQ [Pseudomonadota bacterium]